MSQDRSPFCPSVIDRAEKVDAQQLGELPCIDPVVGAAFLEQSVATWTKAAPSEYSLEGVALHEQKT
jgi:hypothetical protein